MREETGLVVSVGIGPGRLIAKIASALSKPDGLLEVAPAGAESFLRPQPVSRVWGIGPAAREHLARAGILTIGDLADSPLAIVEQALGSSAGTTQSLARGIDHRPVEADGRRHSYGEENTFPRDQTDGPTVRNAIRSHAEAVARHLRANDRLASTIVLKIKLSNRIGPGRYPLLSRRETLSRPTDDGLEMAEVALRLWAVVSPSRTIRLVGVSAQNLVEATHDVQLDLFGGRKGALNRALDAIVDRHGKSALHRGHTHEVQRAAPTRSIKDRPR